MVASAAAAADPKRLEQLGETEVLEGLITAKMVL
jgi:hypothetical protein